MIQLLNTSINPMADKEIIYRACLTATAFLVPDLTQNTCLSSIDESILAEF